MAHEITHTLQEDKLIRRSFNVPLPGWGGVLESLDDSNMSVNLRLKAFESGDEILNQAFRHRGQDISHTLERGKHYHVQIRGNVSVFQDAVIDNGHNRWSIEFTWPVFVTNSGQFQVRMPRGNGVQGGTGDAPWSLNIVSSANTIGDINVGLALSSTENSTTNSSHTVGGETQFTPLGVGGSGGYRYSRGSGSGSSSVAVSSFNLMGGFIAGPSIGTVTAGSLISSQESHIYFDTGQGAITGEKRNRIVRQLLALDPDPTFHARGTGLEINFECRSSPIGDSDDNADLSKERSQSVHDLIKRTLPGAHVKPGDVGEAPWDQLPSNSDDPSTRTCRVTIIDRRAAHDP